MSYRKDETIRIVDKRQTMSGIEYKFSVTGEWLSSSESRRSRPELVELYEWLHNSGFHGNLSMVAFNLARSQANKNIRKRARSSLHPGDTLATIAPREIAPHHTIENTTLANAEEPLETESDNAVIGQVPNVKKLRRDDSFIEGINKLNIDLEASEGKDLPAESQKSTEPGTSESSQPTPFPGAATSTASPAVKTESTTPIKTNEPQVLEFNRNTEGMIEAYFNEGLDASGLETFDLLLGPYRRPSKEFTAAFFYAIVLSPVTDIGTIEGAIHVLDRVLTLHGPEPFQLMWDVQKRRRELLDGKSQFSKAAQSISTSIPNSSTGNTSGGFESSSVDIAAAKRLPGWSNIWELFRGLLGLDTKSETRQYIAFQELQIKSRLFEDDADASNTSSSKTSDAKTEHDEFESTRSKKKCSYQPGDKVPEEQEVREEIGRAIIGLLLRVLEQDAVLKNLSPKSFFKRDVLSSDAYQPSSAARQALDSVFLFASLATSSRYFEWSLTNLSATPSPSPEPLSSSSRGAHKPKHKAIWPLNERAVLNPAGLEILQLGQKILLLLVRFIQAEELRPAGDLPGSGLDWLARETLSRLSKMNKDRTFGPAPVTYGALERYNLDQTRIFLKGLIEGPVLLDTGTGTRTCYRKQQQQEQQQQQQQQQQGVSNADMIEGGTTEKKVWSTTGVVTGSSTFVMAIVGMWFQSTMTGGGVSPSLRWVVDKYTMPGSLRPNPGAAPSTTKSRGGSSLPESLEVEDEDVTGHEAWHARDIERIEWQVMMTELMVWAWIEARGVQRHDIEGTGVGKILYRDALSEKEGLSGWLAMARTLAKIRGTLEARWEDLESEIEDAIDENDSR
ncbi:hypothetical protein BGZ93_001205 [Podila epicladia]|nr:hypothetical protein BGZ92_000943 [Podila epicladia]KAG0084488.1 hypothetical protein BGZ93_001205 [Podila epicladia]